MIDINNYHIADDFKVRGFFGQYAFLSNFYLSNVFLDGACYPSAEHAFQAAKTQDVIARQPFQKTSESDITCSEAKKMGRSLDLRYNWDKIKVHIMTGILFDKFHRHQDLRERLVNTEDRHLEETNHWGDKFWGVDYQTRKGKNYLGKTLMSIRDFFIYG